MAKKDISISDKLEALYFLQNIDAKIDQIAILRGELPVEVEDLEDEIAGLNKRISNVEDEINDFNVDIQEKEALKMQAQELVKRYDKQLSEVKNNREYDALTKEIELQKLELQLCDKKIRDLLKKIEAKKEIVADAQERIDKKEDELKSKKVELEKIIAETEKEEKELLAQSKKSKEQVDDRLLVAYNRIRSAYRNGWAVVSVERNACGGCFAKIPPQRQLEIRQRKKVIVCEHCGRIMVYPLEKEKADLKAREEAKKTTGKRTSRRRKYTV